MFLIIFRKRHVISIFKYTTISNFDVIDNKDKRKIKFSQNFGTVNFENPVSKWFYSTVLHVLNRVTYVSGVCLNAIHLSAKKYYLKYECFDCNIPQEYLVQKSA